MNIPPAIAAYHALGGEMTCDLGDDVGYCIFWPLDKIDDLNAAYRVSQYASGYLGFGSDGGGEMFALSPSGSIVRLPFVGMSPSDTLKVADSWDAFLAMLRGGA